MKRAIWLIWTMTTACHGDITVVQPTDLFGTIASADGHDGPVCLEAYQAWAGDGALEYPMRRIGRTWVDTPGDFAFSVELPLEDGTGLVLYGWQDRDDDRRHCAPGVDDELAGVTVVSEGDVPEEVEVDILLDSACTGATMMFP